MDWCLCRIVVSKVVQQKSASERPARRLRGPGRASTYLVCRLLFVTIALRLAAVTRSWEDLHFWTTTANHWLGLSHDDSRRTKLSLLLELIEALSLQFDPDDDTALHRLTDESDRLFVG